MREETRAMRQEQLEGRLLAGGASRLLEDVAESIAPRDPRAPRERKRHQRLREAREIEDRLGSRTRARSGARPTCPKLPPSVGPGTPPDGGIGGDGGLDEGLRDGVRVAAIDLSRRENWVGSHGGYFTDRLSGR